MFFCLIQPYHNEPTYGVRIYTHICVCCFPMLSLKNCRLNPTSVAEFPVIGWSKSVFMDELQDLTNLKKGRVGIVTPTHSHHSSDVGNLGRYNLT